VRNVAEIIAWLEQIAPPSRAAEWDNLGLLLGSRDAPVARAMTCLTVTPESAQEAVRDGAQLVVSHHPLFFRPVQRLTDGSVEGRIVLELSRAGIAVYSPHTAFDNAEGGINDVLAQRLGMKSVTWLREVAGSNQLKIVVFVPDSDLTSVSDALFAAGSGKIGAYRECSFRIAGTGTFFGSETTQPTVGHKGRREQAPEWRLEVVCPVEKSADAIAAMRAAHSYEEPAFDVYRLESTAPGWGEGRIGVMSSPEPVGRFADRVKQVLRSQTVGVVGDLNREVERVAIACGAGGEFVGAALCQKAHVLITGEARFHDCLAARAQGLALILPGHFATERPAVEDLAVRLQSQFPDLKTWASVLERDPIEFP
jgi:dinuclear metal center YbgI/SA1388 family protein